MRFQLGDALCDGLAAFGDTAVIDQTNALIALGLHDVDQVGVLHGCERVVFHAAVAQQHIADKQMPFEHGALVVGKRRCGNGEVAVHGLHQRFGDRADIAAHLALVKAVKSGAVFEIHLFDLLRLQPVQGLKRLSHGLLRRDGA